MNLYSTSTEYTQYEVNDASIEALSFVNQFFYHIEQNKKMTPKFIFNIYLEMCDLSNRFDNCIFKLYQLESYTKYIKRHQQFTTKKY